MKPRTFIKSGTTDDYLKKENREQNFFLSKMVIPNAPSTKVRDQQKRDIVLAIEIEQLRRNFNPEDFKLASSRRKYSER